MPYSLKNVGMDTGSLTDEELRYIDTKIVEAVRPALIGRRLLPINTLPHAGFLSIRGYRATDMSKANMSLYGTGKSIDAVKLAAFDTAIPVIKKDFQLMWRDILASRGGGLPIDTINIQNAARKCAEEEDAAILVGETTLYKRLGIEGLATATGRNESNGGDWSAGPEAEIASAIQLLVADGHGGPYAIILPPILWGELYALIASTAVTHMEVVQKMCTKGVFVSTQLTAADDAADSVLVIDPSPGNFELVIGKEIDTFMQQDKDMNIDGQVYEVAAPRILQPTAICEINTLT
jgi:uncharacterized linocin/CFP29 family protein